LPFQDARSTRFAMTNRLAVWLALIIAALLAYDYYQFDWANTVFLIRKFVDLIEWIAFWR
jgi:hypothetical protein